MKSETAKKILKKLKQYDTIVIARHIGPDPDAICSQIALRDFLLENFPKKKVYAVGSGVAKFKKYGLLDKIEPKEIKNCLLVALDVPNFYRVDGIENLNFKEVIKIDHHPYEEDFGKIEWIDETACSTCQMVAKIILNSNYKLSENVASNLFCGIVSDSDRFLLSYTTVETFKIVTALIERTKLPFHKLYEKLYERSINEVRFHGYIASNLEIRDSGFASIIINQDVIEKFNVDSSTASNMVNDFNYIKDIYVWTFVTYDEKNKIYKINIRSKGPIVNEIAAKYHGGGHKFASGVRLEDKEEINNLLNDLDEACQKYQKGL